MTYLFNIIFQWLASKVPGWLDEHKYGRVAIAVIATVLMFACVGGSAFTATTTLTRCGCTGPTLTPTPSPFPTVTPTVTPSPVVSPTPTITPTTALTCSLEVWYERTDGTPLYAVVDVTDTVNRPEPVYRFDARWKVEQAGAMVSQGTIPNALVPITAPLTAEFTPTGQLNGDLVFTPTVPGTGVFDVFVYGCWIDYAGGYPTWCLDDGDHWGYFGTIVR